LWGVLVPGSEVKRDSTAGRGSLRVAASALVGLVVAIAPSLLLFFGIQLFVRLDVEIVFLCLSLVLGGFVFTALERTRPEWRHGLTFGLAAAAGVTILCLVRMSSDEGVNAGDMAAWALVIVFFGALLGMMGSGLAGAASRPLVAGHAKRGWLRPWHVGAAVAVLALVFMGIASAYPLGPGLSP
jgi:hypothetical protein